MVNSNSWPTQFYVWFLIEALSLHYNSQLKATSLSLIDYKSNVVDLKNNYTYHLNNKCLTGSSWIWKSYNIQGNISNKGKFNKYLYTNTSFPLKFKIYNFILVIDPVRNDIE